MKNLKRNLKKLYTKANKLETENDFVDLDYPDIILQCQKNNQFLKNGDELWVYSKIKYEDVESVRMIFMMKEDCGKMKVVSHVMEIVQVLQELLVNLDYWTTTTRNGYRYLDLIKKNN